MFSLSTAATSEPADDPYNYDLSDASGRTGGYGRSSHKKSSSWGSKIRKGGSSSASGNIEGLSMGSRVVSGHRRKGTSGNGPARKPPSTEGLSAMEKALGLLDKYRTNVGTGDAKHAGRPPSGKAAAQRPRAGSASFDDDDIDISLSSEDMAQDQEEEPTPFLVPRGLSNVLSRTAIPTAADLGFDADGALTETGTNSRDGIHSHLGYKRDPSFEQERCRSTPPTVETSFAEMKERLLSTAANSSSLVKAPVQTSHSQLSTEDSIMEESRIMESARGKSYLGNVASFEDLVAVTGQVIEDSIPRSSSYVQDFASEVDASSIHAASVAQDEDHGKLENGEDQDSYSDDEFEEATRAVNSTDDFALSSGDACAAEEENDTRDGERYSEDLGKRVHDPDDSLSLQHEYHGDQEERRNFRSSTPQVAAVEAPQGAQLPDRVEESMEVSVARTAPESESSIVRTKKRTGRRRVMIDRSEMVVPEAPPPVEDMKVKTLTGPGASRSDFQYDTERGVQMRSFGTQCSGNDAAVQALVHVPGMAGASSALDFGAPKMTGGPRGCIRCSASSAAHSWGRKLPGAFGYEHAALSYGVAVPPLPRPTFYPSGSGRNKASPDEAKGIPLPPPPASPDVGLAQVYLKMLVEAQEEAAQVQRELLALQAQRQKAESMANHSHHAQGGDLHGQEPLQASPPPQATSEAAFHLPIGMDANVRATQALFRRQLAIMKSNLHQIKMRSELASSLWEPSTCLQEAQQWAVGKESGVDTSLGETA